MIYMGRGSRLVRNHKGKKKGITIPLPQREIRIVTDPPERGPLTIVDKRWHSGTLLLQLAGPSGEVAKPELGGRGMIAMNIMRGP